MTDFKIMKWLNKTDDQILAIKTDKIKSMDLTSLELMLMSMLKKTVLDNGNENWDSYKVSFLYNGKKIMNGVELSCLKFEIEIKNS